MKRFFCSLLVAGAACAEPTPGARHQEPAVDAHARAATASQAAESEGSGGQHANRFLLYACGAIAVLSLLALLAGGRSGARRGGRQPEEPRAEPEPPPRQKPPAPAKSSCASAEHPSLRVLQPATVATQAEDALPCPECGALVDCPSSIRETNVICGSCRKAFRVH
jgi:hypothetical protein